jgi:hypothetical protein
MHVHLGSSKVSDRFHRFVERDMRGQTHITRNQMKRTQVQDSHKYYLCSWLLYDES